MPPGGSESNCSQFTGLHRPCIFSLRDRRARFIWRLKIKTAGYQIVQKKKEEEEEEEGRKTTLNRLNCEKSRRESSPRTPGGGGYSHTLPIRVCAAQKGRDFEASDLERGIRFRGVF